MDTAQLAGFAGGRIVLVTLGAVWYYLAMTRTSFQPEHKQRSAGRNGGDVKGASCSIKESFIALARMAIQDAP